jgi:hypothetical protein
MAKNNKVMFPMIKEKTQVLVFKTNIGVSDKDRILELLRAQDFVKDVNVDLEDCDRVLRIEGAEVTMDQIINLVTGQGFHCEELN